MLAARRLQIGCPSCTGQILRLYVNSVAEIAPAAAAHRTTRRFSPRTMHPGRRNDSRSLSTRSSKLQSDGIEKSHATESLNPGADELPQHLKANTPPSKELANEQAETPEEGLLDEAEEDKEDLPVTQDTETIVRQAKRLFGDSLPAGYLNEDEYKLYERFYGAPLRRTAPEDVGFGSFGESEADTPNKKAQNALLREDEDGVLQEVQYVADQATEVGEDGEEMLVDGEGKTITARAPNGTQIEYIEAHARNQREYDALLRLQKDFEAARLRAVREQQKMERAAQQEEVEEAEKTDRFEQEVDEDEEKADAQLDMEVSSDRSRLHEYTLEGVFRTSPRTLFLPKEQFIEPITELLRRTDTKHIREAAEKALGGPGFPHGPATPTFAKSFPQRGLALEAGHKRMSEINADAYMSTSMPGIYASVMSTLVEVRKRLGPEWVRGLLNRKEGEDVGPRVLDSGAGGAGLAAWNEIVRAEWDLMRETASDLDATPPGRKSVVVGSNQLRHRISRFLDNTQFLPRLPQYSFVENSHKQLDAPEVQQRRKVYDVIIAAHSLMPLANEYKRRDMLDNLWSLLSPDGGVLIVLEKGHPRGFEAVAEVRQRLLDEFILAPTAEPRTDFAVPENLPRIREPGMIIAPCTNHVKCPMYHTPGLSLGRKDFCHFNQRFTRPQFLQRVLGETSRNYEDINFSFLAIRRGMPVSPSVAEPTADATADTTADLSEFSAQPTAASLPAPPERIQILQGESATRAALAGYENAPSNSSDRPHPLSLPRSILPPLKGKGHVTLDLCTPSGTIERWTVPKSFSKQAHHDARKARWGDLWALGAKTRVRRNVRLGRGHREGDVVLNDGGIRAARRALAEGLEPTKKGKSSLLVGGRAGKKPKLRVVELGQSNMGTIVERVSGVQGKRPERRTKDGRKPPRPQNLLRMEEED